MKKLMNLFLTAGILVSSSIYAVNSEELYEFGRSWDQAKEILEQLCHEGDFSFAYDLAKDQLSRVNDLIGAEEDIAPEVQAVVDEIELTICNIDDKSAAHQMALFSNEVPAAQRQAQSAVLPEAQRSQEDIDIEIAMRLSIVDQAKHSQDVLALPLEQSKKANLDQALDAYKQLAFNHLFKQQNKCLDRDIHAVAQKMSGMRQSFGALQPVFDKVDELIAQLKQTRQNIDKWKAICNDKNAYFDQKMLANTILTRLPVKDENLVQKINQLKIS